MNDLWDRRLTKAAAPAWTIATVLSAIEAVITDGWDRLVPIITAVGSGLIAVVEIRRRRSS